MSQQRFMSNGLYMLFLLKMLPDAYGGLEDINNNQLLSVQCSYKLLQLADTVC